MKAYQLNTKYDFCSVVVFAETRNKAKTMGVGLDLLDYPAYIEIEARRLPQADKMYKNRSYMEWDDEQDRLFLVKECGWHCDPEYRYYANPCEECIAKKYCDYGDDIKIIEPESKTIQFPKWEDKI